MSHSIHITFEQFQVKRVVIHKDYKAPTFENDIAILELETPIERQPHVVPICMPEDDNEEFLGRMGIVTGWGRLEYGKLDNYQYGKTQNSSYEVHMFLICI